MRPVPVRYRSAELTAASIVALIPARFHSSRLPGKPLADIGGQPMIAHVVQRAAAAASIDAVIVATDDPRVVEAVVACGGEARLTDPAHRSGTDRLAEVAATLPCGIVVNVQGDEPLLSPAAIDEAVAPLLADPTIEMSTLCRPLEDAEAGNPHIVKVVRDAQGFALYFSRSPIPFLRDADAEAATPRWAHVGLYVYRRDTLLRLARLAPTPLERAESLEQLRALEHGIRIAVVETTHAAAGVDTPDDLERVRQQWLAAGSSV
ncbi:MAG: 3-deoxy-manno-octulosonate cytidylyltransferase [Vicinamibacterales bacterium]|nr:3-deoxy-manno-octulosonate cytidylyltransferase [Vicinamibacterales bacterium]